MEAISSAVKIELEKNVSFKLRKLFLFIGIVVKDIYV
jgi:hypothetical protein